MQKTSKFHALGLAGALLAWPVALPAATAASPVISHEARVASPLGLHSHGGVHSTWSASNWSGYAETGTFAGVSGTWTVPSVSATSSPSYSSSWIGVDGFNNSNLIQTGTEQDYYKGAAHYDAWWEILPAAETEISPGSYPVSPGDRMSASIYETTTIISTGGRHQRQTGREWVITISDQSHGWKFTTDQAYSGPGTSAEWIMEAPEVGGRIASLAHYTVTPPTNTGDFDNAGILTTPASAGTPTYKGAALNYANDSGVMIQNGTQVSTPGNPDGALTAYNVAYGSTAPAAPAG